MSCLGAPRLRPLLPPHYHHPQSGRRQPQDVPEDPCAVDPESSHEPPSPPRALSPQPHISPPPPLTIASPVTGKSRSTVQQSAHPRAGYPVQKPPGAKSGPGRHLWTAAIYEQSDLEIPPSLLGHRKKQRICRPDLSPDLHRTDTSSSTRTTAAPQEGHLPGIRNTCSVPSRTSVIGATTWGMTSPAL